LRPLSCLSQLLVTGALVVGWYVLVRLPVRLHFPENEAAEIDTRETNSTLADAAPNILLYEADRLARPAEHRMVILGSSNAMYSLRPADLRESFPGWEIHSLAIPTSNVQAARQVVDLVMHLSDRGTLSRTLFVLGSYYGLYAQARPLWGGQPSPLTVEMLRYGLYHLAGEGADPVPRLGYKLAWLTKDLYRTLLGIRAVPRLLKRAGQRLLAGEPVGLKLFEATREEPYKFTTAPASEATKLEHNTKRIRQIGTRDTLADEQFMLLEDLTQKITRAGARLLIVDLPVSTWNRLAHFKFYMDQKQSFIRGLASNPGVQYLDLHDSVPDELMSDATHPCRQGSRLYAAAFASGVKQLAGAGP
jgi:hypothetical protein